ncbi:MAG TPA: nucleoside recognition protein [Tepidimicrobium sp.]|nr:nucleoside recognition protein [Tepidimicrobium sp.]
MRLSQFIKRVITLYKESAVRGFQKGIRTLWGLAKIVIPVYFIVTFLGYTPILDIVSGLFEPVMNIVGLPGEASLSLVLGNVVNIYAGVGAMATMALTGKQATILAIMLSFSHSLLLESAVANKAGVGLGLVVFIRVGLALLSGIVLNIIL